MEPLNIEPALLCLKTPEAEVALQLPVLPAEALWTAERCCV